MIIYLSFMALGAVLVFLLFLKEKRPQTAAESLPEERIEEEMPSFLNRLGLDQPTTQPASNSTLNSPSTKTSLLEKTNPTIYTSPQNAGVHAFSPSTDPELTAKCERLEKLLNEKSVSLEKSEKALEFELKNRKEFNKIKDALEKELKDRKDKNHKLDLDLNSVQLEVENHKKRIGLFEVKIKSLEDDLKSKERIIEDLLKRLETATAAAKTIEKQGVSSPQQLPENPAPEPPAVPAEAISEAPEPPVPHNEPSLTSPPEIPPPIEPSQDIPPNVEPLEQPLSQTEQISTESELPTEPIPPKENPDAKSTT